jgi:hypothetical protein
MLEKEPTPAAEMLTRERSQMKVWARRESERERETGLEEGGSKEAVFVTLASRKREGGACSAREG